MRDDKRKKAEAAIMQYINGLFGRTEGYASAVSRHFTSAVNALLDLAAKVDMEPDEVFYFSDNKRLSAKATAILRGLYSAVYQEIRNGVTAEWDNANAATDLMLTRLFGKELQEDNHFARWFARNQEAMDSFFSRKDVHGGLNLSQKVWKYTSQFKEEMELALSASLGRGDSAATVSRHVRQYLKEPDKLFRRVRDAKGNLKLSKRAAAYHPGRGEYRSSYKNAMRLARTETNSAYRAADCDRWGNIPFVVGIEVKRSNHPFGCEVCELLKGKYPKEFVFTGWHPQCRCYIVPVMASEKERMAYHRAILKGEDVRDWHFNDEITEPHDGFKKWIGENQERIDKAAEKGTLPYWIKDNPKYVAVKQTTQEETHPTPSKVASDEHSNYTNVHKVAKDGIDKDIEQHFTQEIKSEQDVIDFMNFKQETKDWFKRGFLKLDGKAGRSNNGETDLKGHISLDPDILKRVISGLEKTRLGKEIIKDEAQAFGTFWHEITHNRTKTGEILTKKGTVGRNFMELANEFVARRTLPEFYKGIGAKMQFEEFMVSRGNCGYNTWVLRYQRIINDTGCDMNKTLQSVKQFLFEQPLDRQQDGLIRALKLQGARKKDGTLLKDGDLRKLVTACIKKEYQFKEKYESIIGQQY